jgi:hypothetical protein
VSWQFIPPYVQNDGDTSTLTITTPKYLRIGTTGTSITFTAGGDDGDGTGASFPVGDTVNGYALYQNWAFDIAGVSVSNTVNVTYYSGYGQHCINYGILRFTNLTNFSLQYPLSVNIVQGSPTYMSGGVVYDLVNYCSTKTANIYFAYSSMLGVYNDTFYPLTTTYLTKVALPNVYKDFIINNGWINLQLITPCGITNYTWVHMQLEFSNTDGFDYILNCGTDY